MQQLGLLLRGGVHRPHDRPTSDWRPPDMATLPSWKGARRIGLDTEGRDPNLRKLGIGVRRDGKMVGVSIAIEDGPKFYLPWGHEDPEDNLPPANVKRYLVDQFKDFEGEVVGANLGYDLDYMWTNGIAMPKVRRFRDCLMADALLYCLHDSYSLENVATRRGFEGKNEDMLRAAARAYDIPDSEVKARLAELPARYVGGYAEDDADLPLRILEKQEREIEDVGCQEAWDLESDLLPILVRMRMRGVRVDMDRLDRIEQWTKEREAEEFAKVKHATGIEIPVGHSMNTTLVPRALDAAGLKMPETATGKKSVRRDWLEEVDHDVARAIVAARKFAKIRGTYVQGMRDHVVVKNGEARIHCTFNQLRKTDDDGGEGGVAYGRMSAEHVNMQNQPSASRSAPGDDTGHTWRSIYLPEPGELWAAKDLKQQEPRWSYHISALLKLPGAEEMCARLRDNPTLDTYMPLAEAAGIKRSPAKIIWLSLCYGKSDGNLCEALGFPKVLVTWDRRAGKPVAVDSDRGREICERGYETNYNESKRLRKPFAWFGAGPEGQAVLDKFEEGAPFLRRAAKVAEKRAMDLGYITLTDGRRLHFESQDKEHARVAFNRVIQGNSAVQTKKIMVRLSRDGFEQHLMLQVHDEVDSSVPNEGVARQMATSMREAVPMRVPTTVDLEMGPSWGESMQVEMPDGSKYQYKWRL
jgi:DNA polymerase I-like protein with 3'-5' exonuclease and polymerase domains